jgi:hypothetical protein
MKTDPQHLLAAHVPFYRRRWFWAVVLFLITILPYIYVTLQYYESSYLVLFLVMVNMSIPLSIFDYFLQYEYAAFMATIITYSTLLYFALFRNKINFYALLVLMSLMSLSTIMLLNMIRSLS